ncbi:MAG: DUF1416 domain-containing protein [Jiangellales bacterium]
MCGALPGEASRPLDDIGTRAVIEGVVSRDDDPLAGAYVRLLDSSGEFTAEVQTDDAGRFRFYAAAGTWTLRTLAAGSEPADQAVDVGSGQVRPVEVLLG